MSLLELFCPVDDFCVRYKPQQHARQLPDGHARRHRPRRLCLSEVMTLLIGVFLSINLLTSAVMNRWNQRLMEQGR